MKFGANTIKFQKGDGNKNIKGVIERDAFDCLIGYLEFLLEHVY